MASPQSELERLTGISWPTQVNDQVWLLLDKRGARPRKDGSVNPNAGSPLPSDSNLERVLGHDPRVAPIIRHDVFADKVFIGKAELDDALEFRLGVWLERIYHMSTSTSRLHGAVVAAAKANPFHPVRNWLGEQAWDGNRRIDTFLTRAMGAEDTQLNRLLSRRWLIGICARVAQPGCKLDTVLVLQGVQGIKKSTTLRALCHDPSWFSDTAVDLHSKDAYQQIQGKLIYEFAEWDSLRRVDLTRVRAFLTSQVDHYRPPYARNAIDQPRTTVFVGSVNDLEFLVDPSGNRRFWPIHTGACYPDIVFREREQLWAEAEAARVAGEAWWLDTSAERVLASTTGAFSANDPWEGMIVEWLSGRKPTPVTTATLLRGAVEIESSRLDRAASQRAASIMVRLGWAKKQNPGRAGVWEWHPPEAKVLELVVSDGRME